MLSTVIWPIVMSLVHMVGGECIQLQESPCVCKFDNGSKIDLRGITKERLANNIQLLTKYNN